MADGALRADALRSRHAIIAAYQSLLSSRGEDVPRYEVARAAGVGQGTLYRHFPTRASLAVAAVDDVLSELEQLARQRAGDPDCFRVLLEQVFQNQVWMHGLSQTMASGRDVSLDPELTAFNRRVLQTFDEPIAVAQRAGVLRLDLTTDDVVVMLAMLAGVLRGTGDPTARRHTALRAVDLLVDGLSAAQATDGSARAPRMHVTIQAAPPPAAPEP